MLAAEKGGRAISNVVKAVPPRRAKRAVMIKKVTEGKGGGEALNAVGLGVGHDSIVAIWEAGRYPVCLTLTAGRSLTLKV